MNWTAATCWALLLAAAFLCDSCSAKGGRGGARGSARGVRGGARGASRVRVRPAPRYGSSLRVAGRAGPAAGAAAGVGVGLATGPGWRRTSGPGELGLEDDENRATEGNGTDRGVYSYWAWTSGSGSTPSPRICLLLGGTLGALELLWP
ncbi:LOW QUALITY PROTEIN: shadow of prion protein [Cricetulus griseus]|uniref:LOW QUALITY PROTEIN: shadow of prion protein n=1 Tax=Cricetulus griseus TaxID=10029 RepID=UPI0004543E65|nr:LOW QUALITY PROTEIN: shadow of prion protein [Cricetulus griseus]